MSKITHKNGGIEQAILSAVNEDGGLSAQDKKRLEQLQSLPQNRTEIIKPIVKLTGQNGNVFNLIGICSLALKKAGHADLAKEMSEKNIQV